MGTADDSTHEANSRPFEARLSRRESDFYSSVDAALPVHNMEMFSLKSKHKKKATNKREWAV